LVWNVRWAPTARVPSYQSEAPALQATTVSFATRASAVSLSSASTLTSMRMPATRKCLLVKADCPQWPPTLCAPLALDLDDGHVSIRQTGCRGNSHFEGCLFVGVLAFACLVHACDALGARFCVLQYVTVCCRVLSCVAVCCSVLQCVAACCSVLQCVAVRCSVL